MPFSERYIYSHSLGAYEACIVAEQRAQDPIPPTPLFAFGFNLPLENLAQLYQTVKFDRQGI